jgi:crotonobetainyl-CoA:carnitine CoA-transferase CaiB-like acyl-CoA transferase
MTVQSLWALLSPYLVELMAGLLAVFIAQVALAVRRRTGLEIEAALRQVLHQALETGATVAVADGKQGGAAVQAAIDHARASAPAAIRKLAPSPDVLVNLALSKLAKAAR